MFPVEARQDLEETGLLTIARSKSSVSACALNWPLGSYSGGEHSLIGQSVI